MMRPHAPDSLATPLRPALVRMGYTLVEVTLVVLIVGIVGTLAVPYLGQASASKLPAAMRLLEADMAYAQAYAISHQDTRCVVVFHEDHTGYHLADAATPDKPLSHPGDKQPYRVTFGQGRHASLAGVTLQTHTAGSDNKLIFAGLGQLDQTTPAHITLAYDQRTMTLRLDPVTGLPRITD